MADPQFGMFASISKLTREEAADRSREGLNLRYVEEEFDGFEPEIKLFTKAIEQANHYEPDFVVMCGDMVNEADSLEQREELFRIADQLDKSIMQIISTYIPKMKKNPIILIATDKKYFKKINKLVKIINLKPLNLEYSISFIREIINYVFCIRP